MNASIHSTLAHLFLNIFYKVLEILQKWKKYFTVSAVLKEYSTALLQFGLQKAYVCSSR